MTDHNTIKAIAATEICLSHQSASTVYRTWTCGPAEHCKKMELRTPGGGGGLRMPLVATTGTGGPPTAGRPSSRRPVPLNARNLGSSGSAASLACTAASAPRAARAFSRQSAPHAFCLLCRLFSLERLCLCRNWCTLHSKFETIREKLPLLHT